MKNIKLILEDLNKEDITKQLNGVLGGLKTKKDNTLISSKDNSDNKEDVDYSETISRYGIKIRRDNTIYDYYIKCKEYINKNNNTGTLRKQIDLNLNNLKKQIKKFNTTQLSDNNEIFKMSKLILTINIEMLNKLISQIEKKII